MVSVGINDDQRYPAFLRDVIITSLRSTQVKSRQDHRNWSNFIKISTLRQFDVLHLHENVIAFILAMWC